MINNHCGRFFVLSAPSGSGKTTVKDRLLARRPDMVYSVSFTTRPPRPGEIDGRDYNFMTRDQFQHMIKAGDLLEWAEIFGHFYGTGRRWVLNRLKTGHSVLADLDVNGGASVRALMPEAVLVFMAPPSAAELRRRLSERQTESAQDLDRRLAAVRAEVEFSRIYDFLLVNDHLEKAIADLEKIIFFGQGQPMAQAGPPFWQEFFQEPK